MAYIYQIRNKINNKVYVGQTSHTLNTRFSQHIYDAFERKPQLERPLYRAIRKYGKENFIIELLEETDNPLEREVYWISKLNSYQDGYNATLGGEGNSKIDQHILIEKYNQIKNIQAVADSLGIHRDTVRRALKENNIEIKDGSDINRENCSKETQMINKNTGEIIKIFPSATDAGRFIKQEQKLLSQVSGIKSHIVQVCNGKRKTAYGYKWKYTDLV